MANEGYQEATRCPECKEPGNVRVKRPAPPQAGLPRGTTVHVVYCENKRCEWFNTSWLVQVNPDGSIPVPRDHTGEPKLYQGFEEHAAMAQRVIDQVEANSDTKPGLEFRR